MATDTVTAPAPYYQHGGITIYHGDCRKVLPLLEAESVSAVVTDPPYGLEFMGKDWDHGVPGVEFWNLIADACKPGATLLAFGGTRTYHRLTCAIEDAGWEVRDCLMWLYGSGMCKSLDISKAIDKAAGAEREVVGRKTGRGATPVQDIRGGSFAGGHGVNSAIDCSAITAPATDAAKLWDGWGTALKPAYEPICLAMKPLAGTFAANALEYGVAGLNVDGCRIGDGSDKIKGGCNNSKGKRESQVSYAVPNETSIKDCYNQGRWPANVILDEEAAAMLDEQSGTLQSGGSPASRKADKFRNSYGTFKGGQVENGISGSIGGASRFFYTAKASRAERGEGNTHPTVKPLAVLEYLCRLVSQPKQQGVLLDPFMGSGSTLLVATKWFEKVIGIDKEEAYCEIAANRLRQEMLF